MYSRCTETPGHTLQQRTSEHLSEPSKPVCCPYVFHGPDCAPGRKPSREHGCVGHFKKAWSTACKAAGFPVGRKHGGFVFHNTRHAASTNLVNAGVSTNDAMEVTGHRTRSVFDRYKIAVKEQTRRCAR